MRYFVLLLLAGVASASTYTRDGGTADWLCCADRACATVISQHADAVRARDTCGALTDRDGVTRWTRSNPFRITAPLPVTPPVTPPAVSAALSWTAPTTNTNGTALTNLTGYRIVYGTSPTSLTQVVQVGNVTSHSLTGLAPGTYYFAVRAVSATGESANSNIASKVVQ